MHEDVVIVWKSITHSCIADSTMEAEYIVALEAPKKLFAS